MSVVDLQELEEVKGLVLKGQQVGVLTFAEISVAVQEIDLLHCYGDLGERQDSHLLALEDQPLHLFEFLQINY